MKKLVALSAIGKDRPGIVAALSKVFFETGCNLEDSSMTRLRGDFAILLLVQLSEASGLVSLKKSLEAAAKEWGLTISIRELSVEEEGQKSGTAALPFTLVVYGLDHPGIVFRVAQAAADEGINIIDLRTHMTSSKGVPIYSLIMEVEIPGQAMVAPFMEILEHLKKELKVEINLTPVEADEL